MKNIYSCCITSIVLLVSGILIVPFSSCQKATPLPAAVMTKSLAIADSNTTTSGPSFKATVNSSSSMTFTGSKSTSGSNTTLKGVNQYYTITITFPSSTPPNTYNLGFDAGFSATVYDGSNTYSVNTSNGGAGSLTISSITNGLYTGTFNFTGVDGASNFESTSGSFSNL